MKGKDEEKEVRPEAGQGAIFCPPDVVVDH